MTSWTEECSINMSSSSSSHPPDTWCQLRRVVCYQFVHLFPGTSDDGKTLSQGRFKGHGAPHSFASPKKKKKCVKSKKPWDSTKIKVRLNQCTSLCYIDSTHTHFSNCVPYTAEFGKFIYALFSDDCAVHIEADSLCPPEELLCLRQCGHRAGKKERMQCETRKNGSKIQFKTTLVADMSSFWGADFAQRPPHVTAQCVQWMSLVQWGRKCVHWVEYLCAKVSAPAELIPSKHLLDATEALVDEPKQSIMTSRHRRSVLRQTKDGEREPQYTWSRRESVKWAAFSPLV